MRPYGYGAATRPPASIPGITTELRGAISLEAPASALHVAAIAEPVAALEASPSHPLRTALVHVVGLMLGMGADSTQDERTGEHYFEVRAALDPTALEGQLASMLTPGMAGDATIETGSRTFFSYLMQPLSDSFSDAFRETH